jgi:hypothetical protein
VADRALGRDAAWLPCSSSALTHECAGELKLLACCYCPPLPPFSRPHPAFSCSQARRAHCHRAAKSSTASHLNRLGQKHLLALFYPVLQLAKPAEQQVRLEKLLLAAAMLRGPPTLHSTVAGAMSCFAMLCLGCFVLHGSCRWCRSHSFYCYRAALIRMSHCTGRTRHVHRRVELQICYACLLVFRLELCSVRRSGISSRAKYTTSCNRPDGVERCRI